MEKGQVRVLALLGLFAAEEHLFTCFLSSPASMRTVLKDERETIKRDAELAMVISIGISALTGYLLRDPFIFLGGTASASGLYYLLLKRGGVL